MSSAGLDATAQAELVRDGEASPAELVDEAIERIERLNPEINAVITPLFDKAREAASGDLPDGPFRGVPFLLKDLGAHSAGDPMYEGMGFLREVGWVEEEESHLARRFREAGFVFFGKTNTPELGILPTTEPLAFGATKNPWDPSRRRAAPAAAPPPRWPRAWWRRHTPTTAAAPSASRPRAAGWWGSSPRAGACPWPRPSATS